MGTECESTLGITRNRLTVKRISAKIGWLPNLSLVLAVVRVPVCISESWCTLTRESSRVAPSLVATPAGGISILRSGRETSYPMALNCF